MLFSFATNNIITLPLLDYVANTVQSDLKILIVIESICNYINYFSVIQSPFKLARGLIVIETNGQAPKIANFLNSLATMCHVDNGCHVDW